MSISSAWKSLLLIASVMLSWAVVVGIGKMGEMFFNYLVFPIDITWPLWLFLFIFFGVFFHANSEESSGRNSKSKR